MFPNIRSYRRFWPLFIMAIGLFLTYACNSGRSKSKPDISNIQLQLPIERFEVDLFQADSNNYAQHFDQLKQKYGDFYDVFAEELMAFGSTKDPNQAYRKDLLGFISNKDIKALKDSVMQAFPNLSQEKAALEEAFKYYKHYYPNSSPPKIISHISAFGPSAITFDTTLVGLNLDSFLGADFTFYASTNTPQYILRKFEREYIPTNVMKVFATSHYEPDLRYKKLVDQMLYHGKLLYFLDQMLPDTPDQYISGYSKEHLEWLQNNEAEIWAFLIAHELLYESDLKKIGKLVSEGPTTPGMPSSSPGNVGSWVGWKMVEKFMDENPEVTLPELMEMKDGQQVLRQSKYKPGRSGIFVGA